MAQQASDFELAHVVLAYLETKGWNRAAASFQRDAKAVLKSGRRPRGQAVRTLDELVNGYLQLSAREAQRATLMQLNPLAGHIYSILDMSAGLAPLQLPPQLPQLSQQQAADLMGVSSGAAAAAAAAAVAAVAGGAMVPMAEMGGAAPPLFDHHQPPQVPQPPPPPPPPQQRPATTPGRHAQRKGAPQRKRRRLDADFDAARPLAPTSPPDFLSNEPSLHGDLPFGDLLYRAVDPAAVMQVLDHEAEALKFSTLLADNINRTAMGADHFPEDPELLFTDLLQDPEAQEIVRRLVASANEGEGGGAAAPPPPLPPPPRPQSGGRAESRQWRGREDAVAAKRPAELGARGRPSNGAAAAAEGDGGAPQEHVDMQYYKDNPDELEDLLDEIVG